MASFYGCGCGPGGGGGSSSGGSGTNITSAYINEAGELVLVFSNGKISNIGPVRGKDGVTFTPQIKDGVLSWTNDGGLENPKPIDFNQFGGNQEWEDIDDKMDEEFETLWQFIGMPSESDYSEYVWVEF